VARRKKDSEQPHFPREAAKAARVGAERPEPHRSGTVAIIGRPNVGKSTLLNAALEHPLAIVSPTPQTTRETLLGVVRHGSAELCLLDTPGLHKARSELNRAMNRAARAAAREANVVVFMTEPGTPKEGALHADARDASLLADLPAETPVILVVNKVDRVKDKGTLLPLLDELSKLRNFAAIVPTSAKRVDGVERVLREVALLLPEGPHRFGEDEMTDKPTRFFAAEYVREQVLLATKEEVPHATAVTIDAFEETRTGYRISATLHVERPGQKKIIVGKGGEMLKRIGTYARRRIEELTGQKIRLELFVRVTPGWRDSPALLVEMSSLTAGTEQSAGERDL
jgi:GTPase